MTTFAKIEEFKPNVIASLEEIQELDITCKSILKRYLTETESADSSAIIKIQSVIDYMYEHVNIGNWKEVRSFLRKTVTIASYLKVLILLKCSGEPTKSIVMESLKILDFGLLFGCPIAAEYMLLQDCATILSSLYSASTSGNSSKSNIIPEVNCPGNNKYNATEIEKVDCPSMENFYTNYILTETPVILENCINHWPALTKWKDQDYFIKVAGLRTVSIELGKDYTDSEWTQKLMTIENFVKNHIYQSSGPTAYLAQYQLFEQIPELREDIIEPEYCYFSNTDEAINIMAWYGPKGTVSPLHHDPKRNLLAQVVGQKQIFLFSPNQTEYLYPHEHELLRNTARVDPRNPDLVKHPKYKDVKGYYCVLQPGQLLYIPPKWWHFVESLSISFSVSFWWQ